MMKVVSFIFPIVGWIYYFARKDVDLEEARECAKWAWIGFGVGILLILIYY